MGTKPKRRLIIIGGAEDKQGDREILQAVCEVQKNGAGKLTVITVATQLPEEVGRQYKEVFAELGVKDLEILDIRKREDALQPENVERLLGSNVVFLTGGDQLRITSQLGDSPIYSCLHELYQQGATIVGTSAGASVMSQTMLVSGESDDSFRAETLHMAPGLGLIKDVLIDQHFAQRGRIGRLSGAVAHNPANLGVGIDEDTAIIVEDEKRFRVIGSGAVYVLDASESSYSNLSALHPDDVLTALDIKLHILGPDSEFDLVARRPLVPAEVA